MYYKKRCLLKNDTFMYFKVRVIKKTQIFSTNLFTPRMATTGQEPKTPFIHLMWVWGIRALRPSSAAVPGALVGSWFWSGGSGILNQCPCGMSCCRWQLILLATPKHWSQEKLWILPCSFLGNLLFSFIFGLSNLLCSWE